MTTIKAPTGLGAGGRKLWRELTTLHEMDALQLVQLEEACRSKDRLDKLDEILRGDVATWVAISEDREGDLAVTVDKALEKANATATVMKQLLAAMRLPDEATGKRPQQRGGGRGSYRTGGDDKKLSARDRLRAV